MTPRWMDSSRIKYLTIHCTATPEGRPNTAAEISAWDKERWGQVSYHHVIELDGRVVQTLADNQIGCHVRHNNTGNIGVSYVGGTETLNAGGKPKDTRTQRQRDSMLRIVRHYRSLFPNIIIRGHRDWPGVAKACPSFNVAAWLKAEGLA